MATNKQYIKRNEESKIRTRVNHLTEQYELLKDSIETNSGNISRIRAELIELKATIMNIQTEYSQEIDDIILSEINLLQDNLDDILNRIVEPLKGASFLHPTYTRIESEIKNIASGDGTHSDLAENEKINKRFEETYKFDISSYNIRDARKIEYVEGGRVYNTILPINISDQEVSVIENINEIDTPKVTNEIKLCEGSTPITANTLIGEPDNGNFLYVDKPLLVRPDGSTVNNIGMMVFENIVKLALDDNGTIVEKEISNPVLGNQFVYSKINSFVDIILVSSNGNIYKYRYTDLINQGAPTPFETFTLPNLDPSKKVMSAFNTHIVYTTTEGNIAVYDIITESNIFEDSVTPEGKTIIDYSTNFTGKISLLTEDSIEHTDDFTENWNTLILKDAEDPNNIKQLLSTSSDDTLLVDTDTSVFLVSELNTIYKISLTGLTTSTDPVELYAMDYMTDNFVIITSSEVVIVKNIKRDLDNRYKDKHYLSKKPESDLYNNQLTNNDLYMNSVFDKNPTIMSTVYKSLGGVISKRVIIDNITSKLISLRIGVVYKRLNTEERFIFQGDVTILNNNLTYTLHNNNSKNVDISINIGFKHIDNKIYIHVNSVTDAGYNSNDYEVNMSVKNETHGSDYTKLISKPSDEIDGFDSWVDICTLVHDYKDPMIIKNSGNHREEGRKVYNIGYDDVIISNENESVDLDKIAYIKSKLDALNEPLAYEIDFSMTYRSPKTLKLRYDSSVDNEIVTVSINTYDSPIYEEDVYDTYLIPKGLHTYILKVIRIDRLDSKRTSLRCLKIDNGTITETTIPVDTEFYIVRGRKNTRKISNKEKNILKAVDTIYDEESIYNNVTPAMIGENKAIVTESGVTETNNTTIVNTSVNNSIELLNDLSMFDIYVNDNVDRSQYVDSKFLLHIQDDNAYISRFNFVESESSPGDIYPKSVDYIVMNMKTRKIEYIYEEFDLTPYDISQVSPDPNVATLNDWKMKMSHGYTVFTNKMKIDNVLDKNFHTDSPEEVIIDLGSKPGSETHYIRSTHYDILFYFNEETNGVSGSYRLINPEYDWDKSGFMSDSINMDASNLSDNIVVNSSLRDWVMRSLKNKRLDTVNIYAQRLVSDIAAIQIWYYKENKYIIMGTDYTLHLIDADLPRENNRRQLTDHTCNAVQGWSSYSVRIQLSNTTEHGDLMFYVKHDDDGQDRIYVRDLDVTEISYGVQFSDTRGWAKMFVGEDSLIFYYGGNIYRRDGISNALNEQPSNGSLFIDGGTIGNVSSTLYTENGYIVYRCFGAGGHLWVKHLNDPPSEAGRKIFPFNGTPNTHLGGGDVLVCRDSSSNINSLWIVNIYGGEARELVRSRTSGQPVRISEHHIVYSNMDDRGLLYVRDIRERGVHDGRRLTYYTHGTTHGTAKVYNPINKKLYIRDIVAASRVKEIDIHNLIDAQDMTFYNEDDTKSLQARYGYNSLLYSGPRKIGKILYTSTNKAIVFADSEETPDNIDCVYLKDLNSTDRTSLGDEIIHKNASAACSRFHWQWVEDFSPIYIEDLNSLVYVGIDNNLWQRELSDTTTDNGTQITLSAARCVTYVENSTIVFYSNNGEENDGRCMRKINLTETLPQEGTFVMKGDHNTLFPGSSSYTGNNEVVYCQSDDYGLWLKDLSTGDSDFGYKICNRHPFNPMYVEDNLVLFQGSVLTSYHNGPLYGGYNTHDNFSDRDLYSQLTANPVIFYKLFNNDFILYVANGQDGKYPLYMRRLRNEDGVLLKDIDDGYCISPDLSIPSFDITAAGMLIVSNYTNGYDLSMIDPMELYNLAKESEERFLDNTEFDITGIREYDTETGIYKHAGITFSMVRNLDKDKPHISRPIVDGTFRDLLENSRNHFDFEIYSADYQGMLLPHWNIQTDLISQKEKISSYNKNSDTNIEMSFKTLYKKNITSDNLKKTKIIDPFIYGVDMENILTPRIYGDGTEPENDGIVFPLVRGWGYNSYNVSENKLYYLELTEILQDNSRDLLLSIFDLTTCKKIESYPIATPYSTQPSWTRNHLLRFDNYERFLCIYSYNALDIGNSIIHVFDTLHPERGVQNLATFGNVNVTIYGPMLFHLYNENVTNVEDFTKEDIRIHYKVGMLGGTNYGGDFIGDSVFVDTDTSINDIASSVQYPVYFSGGNESEFRRIIPIFNTSYNDAGLYILYKNLLNNKFSIYRTLIKADYEPDACLVYEEDAGRMSDSPIRNINNEYLTITDKGVIEKWKEPQKSMSLYDIRNRKKREVLFEKLDGDTFEYNIGQDINSKTVSSSYASFSYKKKYVTAWWDSSSKLTNMHVKNTLIIRDLEIKKDDMVYKHPTDLMIDLDYDVANLHSVIKKKRILHKNEISYLTLTTIKNELIIISFDTIKQEIIGIEKIDMESYNDEELHVFMVDEDLITKKELSTNTNKSPINVISRNTKDNTLRLLK